MRSDLRRSSRSECCPWARTRVDGRFDTGAVRRAIDEMAAGADVVMIDAPARAAATTGTLVAACDAVLFVGLFRSTSLEDARRTGQELKMLGTPSIGIVMLEQRLPHRYGRTSEGPLGSEQPDSPTVDRPDDRPESSSARDLLTGAARESPTRGSADTSPGASALRQRTRNVRGSGRASKP
jgi:hypothetical protein